jgi:hypothetical protein
MSRISEAETSGVRGRSWPVALVVVASILSCGPFLAGQSGKAGANRSGAEDFFIVSSVDIAKKQLLLKEPTEITEVLQVNEKTRYTDNNGKPMQFADLRAGDTVYIRSTTSSAGKVAVSIRKGPMTLEELLRRYLK